MFSYNLHEFYESMSLKSHCIVPNAQESQC